MSYRPLDWRRVLTEHRVPFVESGPNVKRGEINIKCCWCGSADPSQHMGLNLTTGWWSCWRNRAQHSGKSPLRLLMKLLGVPYGQAREIAGLGNDYVDPEGFDAVAARFMGRGADARPGSVERRFLALDDRFVPVTDRPRTRRWWNYVYGRGFSGESAAGHDADLVCEMYKLHAGAHGAWRDRLVIPYYMDGELVTWTARAITPATHRYWDLDLESSLCPPKHTLYNHDAMYDPRASALVVVEGPLDALKVDFYGRPWGVRAVALSTNSVTDEQAFLLQPSGRFRQVLVMMDNAGALGIVDSMRMKQALSFLPNLSVVPVPFGAKDAGELTPQQATTWAQALTT